ncbi:unnamed protein product [Vitrella brassicaformis CCMP3155]|uniref:PH domain-containing protein n=2 Tax=Vitrella brassicaformis TaxID=1169539 RepID=A0A0G4EJ64_VITBC|nr:unnamed protein product [Vitrella brassicaformis CCMP3155]|eukprot:CEL97051.1 unnamed protein product [Vitrella brassicaformis CCMP3155]
MVCECDFDMSELDRHSETCNITVTPYVLHQGELMKWTNYVKAWRPRHFTVELGVLKYSHEKGGPLRDSFALSECGLSLCHGDAHRFEIATPRGRVTLKAASKEDKERWLDALTKAKGGLHNASLKPPARTTDGSLPNYSPTPSIEATDDDNSTVPQLTFVEQLGETRTRLRDKMHDYAKHHEMAIRIVGELEDEAAQQQVTECLDQMKSILWTIEALSDQQFSQAEAWAKKETRRHMALENTFLHIGKENHQLARAASRLGSKEGGVLNADEEEEEGEWDDYEDFFDAAEKLIDESTAAAAGASPLVYRPDYGTVSSSAAVVSNGSQPAGGIQRRTRLPVPRAEIKVSLWNILKEFIGKDLSRISMPIFFNEPTSFLQRLAEDLQYTALVRTAASLTDPLERLVYMAVFSVTPFASTVGRFVKPFNPLLGETYEITHRGFRFIAEQVGHHPPVSAYHAESDDFVIWGHVHLKNRFIGKSVEAIPSGSIHCVLPRVAEADHFTWARPHMVVHNILFGRLWVEWYGTVLVTNHSTGDVAIIELLRKGWFDKKMHQLRGVVQDKHGRTHWLLGGSWSAEVWAERCDPGPIPSDGNSRPTPTPPHPQHTSPEQEPLLQHHVRGSTSSSLMSEASGQVDGSATQDPSSAAAKRARGRKGSSSSQHSYHHHPPPVGSMPIPEVDWESIQSDPSTRRVLWSPTPLPAHAEQYFNYSQMAMELNEITPEYDRQAGAHMPRTDSRFRPDQRAYEEGRLDEASSEKTRLEDRQREAAKKRPRGEQDYSPLWFQRSRDKYTGEATWAFRGSYWEKKRHNDFKHCPHIFGTTH